MDTAEVPRAALHPLIGESGARLPQSKTSPESHSQECFSGLFRCERFYGRTAIQLSAFSSFWLCRLYQGFDTERFTRVRARTISAITFFAVTCHSRHPLHTPDWLFHTTATTLKIVPDYSQNSGFCKAAYSNSGFRIGNLQYRGGVITVPR